MKQLSIVIPTKHRPDDILQIFKDLSQQSTPADVMEVVVFNDGANTKTRDIILQDWPFEVLYLESDECINSSIARNRCLDRVNASRGVLFLDDDMRLSVDFIEQCLKALQTYPACCCRVLTPNTPSAKTVFPKWLRRKVVPWLGYLSGGFGEQESRTSEVDHLPGCMMMFRSEYVSGVRFDAWIGGGNGFLDDADFSYSVKRTHAISLWYVPTFSVLHVQSGSGGNREHSARRWLEYSFTHRRWFFKKHLASVWQISLFVSTFFETVLRSLRDRQNYLPVWVRSWQASLPK